MKNFLLEVAKAAGKAAAKQIVKEAFDYIKEQDRK